MVIEKTATRANLTTKGKSLCERKYIKLSQYHTNSNVKNSSFDCGLVFSDHKRRSANNNLNRLSSNIASWSLSFRRNLNTWSIGAYFFVGEDGGIARYFVLGTKQFFFVWIISDLIVFPFQSLGEFSSRLSLPSYKMIWTASIRICF